jgi:hypothetical protein
MNRIASTIGAASILVLSGVAYGAQPMTAEQMDSVTAGGIALGTAVANAFGPNTVATTAVASLTQSLGSVSTDPQFGSFEIIQSNVSAAANSVSGAAPPFGNPAVAVGIANSTGQTVGDLLSDTQSAVATMTTNISPSMATAAAANSSLAVSYTIYSSAISNSTGLATLTR